MRTVMLRPADTRPGFTLAELIVAMVLFAIIGISIVKTLSTGQRAYDAQVQHIDMQQNVRMASSFLTGELRELDASDGDIQAMDSVSIRIRSLRQLGIVCTVPALGGALNLQVLAGVTFAVRDTLESIRYFAPADSILVYYEGDPTTRSDDSWLAGAFSLGSDPGTGALTACTDVAGRQGRQFRVDLFFDNTAPNVQLNSAGNIAVGSPIRAFQSVTYKRLQVGSDWFLGFDSLGVASTNQPLIGPLADSLGLQFTYYDSLNARLTPPYTAAVRRKVARISIALALKTTRPIRRNLSRAAPDTSRVTLEVALRNNRRY